MILRANIFKSGGKFARGKEGTSLEGLVLEDVTLEGELILQGARVRVLNAEPILEIIENSIFDVVEVSVRVTSFTTARIGNYPLSIEVREWEEVGDDV